MISYFMHMRGRVVSSAPYSAITHFIADRKYVIAHAGGVKLILDETLKEIAGSHDDLIQIHRSTLVKAGQMERLVIVSGTNKGFVVLNDGQQLRVSRRNISDVRLALDREAYQDAEGWRDAGYAIGAKGMPTGYILTKKGGMYRWTHPDSGAVSSAKRDKWIVYRSAKAEFKSKLENKNE